MADIYGGDAALARIGGTELRLTIAFADMRRRVQGNTDSPLVSDQDIDATKLMERRCRRSTLRRVTLIERQRDQSESAAVSSVRARQRRAAPAPRCRPLPRPAAAQWPPQ